MASEIETIDTRPKEVDIFHYAGDTLLFTVTPPAGFVDGYQWNGQIRKTREATSPIDAVFQITPPPEPGAKALVILKAEDCARLAGTGVLVRRRTPSGNSSSMLSYTGVWDVQVKPPGAVADPVITLVHGAITLDLDVTRLVPGLNQ